MCYGPYKFLARVVTKRFPDIRNISIFSSNRLVVEQLCGRWEIRVHRLQGFAEKINSTLSGINWGITWLPKAANSIKDLHWEHYNQESDSEKNFVDKGLKQHDRFRHPSVRVMPCRARQLPPRLPQNRTETVSI